MQMHIVYRCVASVFVFLGSIASHAAVIHSVDRETFQAAISGGSISGENFDSFANGTILGATAELTYGASNGFPIVTNQYLTSTSPNGLGSTSVGFFPHTESASFTFSSHITAFGIDINTFATQDGAYTAHLDTGDTVYSIYEEFPGRSTGQFIGFLSNTPFNSLSISANTGYSYTLDTLSYGNLVPVSSSPTHDVRLSTFSVTNSVDGDAVSQSTTVGFDPSAPTYVITHGWQPSADYSTPGWSFTEQTRPSNLDETLDAIESRLLSEAVDEHGNPLKVNVVLAEWAGAYTGGTILDALFNGEMYTNSALARYNSDYAGLLLGIALENELGRDYDQDLHFIGHSYGALVNGLATKYLSQTGWFNSDQQTIQFTTLDAPTNRDLFAPKFPKDWFSTNIATQVDYFDNYYGDGLAAFGERYTGNFNQKVGYSHVAVPLLLSPGIWEGFYDSLIIEGADADTRGFVPLFEDWATPVLGTIPIGKKFTSRLFGSEERRWDTSDVVFQDLINAETIKLNTFTLYDCGGSRWNVFANDVCGNTSRTYSFPGVYLEERSPVAFSQFIEFPDYAEYLSFDWMVASGGDGDWFSLFFGDQLLWNMGIDPLFEGILNRAYVDISAFAGMNGDLIFSLFSVGERNAGLYLGDLTVLSDPVGVPEPPVLALLMFGLGMIVLQRKRRIQVRK